MTRMYRVQQLPKKKKSQVALTGMIHKALILTDHLPKII